MLAFARRQELEPSAVDLSDLVRGMTDLLERTIGRSIRIEPDFPGTLPRALVDANQLELAILNLVVNARDAMPEGGTITIAAREAVVGEPGTGGLAADRRYVCLSVTDQGQGMDEGTLAKAMEPFFTTKAVGQGTGLGLSMVHGLAEQSHGRLILKSEKGSGTTAEIWLPVCEASQSSPEPKRAARVSPIQTGSLTVLVVDDDPLVLENTARMLEDLGHRVFEASSGESALRVLRRQRGIDLVLTDHAMPGMTGLQVVEAIKASWPNIPVVLTTGYALDGRTAGIPKLTKPFSGEVLAQAVSDAMSERNHPVVL
jgi:CheY-like chemotaxis protein